MCVGEGVGVCVSVWVFGCVGVCVGGGVGVCGGVGVGVCGGDGYIITCILLPPQNNISNITPLFARTRENR